MLTGAAGALGAAYCSPYLTAVDGAYHARPGGQTSAMGSSRLVPWLPWCQPGFVLMIFQTLI